MSKIEWTEKTWNPIVGCSKVSPGCKNCYAIGMAWRLQHIGHSAAKYMGTVEKTPGGQINWTGGISVPNISNLSYSDPHGLLAPLSWKQPKMVFVNSMSDLFHDAVPFEIIDCIFAVMVLTAKHTYQVLTKRPARMVEYFSAGKETLVQRWEDATYSMGLCDKDEDPDAPACLVHNICEREWPVSNIWLGVSVENQQAADERIPLLLQVPAAVRFLSCEPLLGPVDLERLSWYGNSYYQVLKPITGCGNSNRPAIDWVIVGGESGKDARPMHTHWARRLRDQCGKAGVKYFFKQWGEWIECGQEPGFIAGSQVRKVLNILPDGSVYTEGVIRAGDLACMKKVGKDLSGRQLDGREWNEFPGQQPEPAEDPDLYAGGFDY